MLIQKEIASDVESEQLLEEEAGIIHNVLSQISRYQEDREQNAGQKWKLPSNGGPICLFSGNTTRTIIRSDDGKHFLRFFLPIFFQILLSHSIFLPSSLPNSQKTK